MSDSAATHLGLHGSSEYDLLDRLAEEFIERIAGPSAARGITPKRHPDLAEEIRELFPALVQIEQVEGDLRDPGGRKGASSVPEPVPRRDRSATSRRSARSAAADGDRLRGPAGLARPPGGAEGPARAPPAMRAHWSGSAARHGPRRGCTTHIVPVYEVGHEGSLLLRDAVHRGPGSRPGHRRTAASARVARRDGRRGNGRRPSSRVSPAGCWRSSAWRATCR